MHGLFPENKFHQQQLLQVRYWTGQLLSFQITRPASYRFQPGQFARLGLVLDGAALTRPFSVVSSVTDEHLEFYALLVEGGSFSQALRALQVAEPIWLEHQAYGFMTPDQFVGGEQLWMIATGTGLGPFISILSELEIWQRYRELIVVHGIRSLQDAAYVDELNALANRFGGNSGARLQLLHCCSRDTASALLTSASLQPLCISGRVTDAFANGLLEQQTGLAITPEQSRIMLCGNPAMIEQMRNLLRARGLVHGRRHTPGQLLTENYW